MSAARSLLIPPSRCGPPSSANGGWTAGLLAAALLEHTGVGSGVPVTVTLRRPPPLDVALPVLISSGSARSGATARLMTPAAAPDNVADTIAEAVLDRSAPLEPVPAVDVDVAMAAEQRYAGRHEHPFPTCFVCGTARGAAAGLRLRPGRIDGGRSACTWTTQGVFAGSDGRLAAAYVWSALDCPGGWTTDLVGRPLVLGRLTALVHRLPAASERLVVVGRHQDTEGRKTRTATTVYDAVGRIVGRADQLWISVDPATFGSAARGTD